MIPKKLAEPPAHVEIYLDANAVFQLERLGVNQERDEEEYRWRFVYSKKPVKISRAYNTRTSVLTISLLAPLVEIASKFPRPVAGPISVLPY